MPSRKQVVPPTERLNQGMQMRLLRSLKPSMQPVLIATLCIVTLGPKAAAPGSTDVERSLEQ